MTRATFSFGRNWQNFLKCLNEEKIKNAKESLGEFVKVKGKTFLDIGSGSGLFSYAAYEFGSKKVVSFDPDPFSVKCAEHMHK